MAYRYRLETVLNYRRDLEELAQQNLARQLILLDEQKKKLDGLRFERTSMISDFEKQKEQPMPAQLFVSFVESLKSKESDIVSQKRAVDSQQKVVVAAREEVAEKMKQRKVLEKSRERDFQKFLQEELSKDQKDNDEMMILRHGRKNMFVK